MHQTVSLVGDGLYAGASCHALGHFIFVTFASAFLLKVNFILFVSDSGPDKTVLVIETGGP